MDRNTIIAIVLTVIVITVGMTIQTAFFSPEVSETAQSETVTDVSAEIQTPSSSSYSYTAIAQGSDANPFVVSTDAMSVTFDPKGASVSSIVLNNEGSSGENLDILIKDSSGKNAFLMYPSTDFNTPITDVFNYTVEKKSVNRTVNNVNQSIEMTVVSFSQKFKVASSDQVFTIDKSFALPSSKEYMMQLAITISSDDGSALPISFYTLGYDPQVGPSFTNLSGNYDYRRMYYKRADKSGKNTVSFKNNTYSTSETLDWAALAGKYFAIIAIPQSGVNYETTFVQKENSSGISQSDSFYLTRQGVNGSSVTDVYSFYTGPKVTSYLNMYDLEKDNAFSLSGLKLNKVMDTSAWLGWLETILKWCLTLFYKVIPNYGVAIILLTFLIKLLLQPLSKKGMDSTAKMSALGPKMDELKKKYADDPQAMNAAMAKLYKEEGINPMGSCLPMLIQFPILIAFYGLLNNHYELRGAMFIPGWIPDLSIPETIFTLPFSIPFLGSQIHLLPIIYTVSMILSMKITQTASTQNSQQGMMNFMTYGMPIIFFFVLYNAPSGLLVYWTTMNMISTVQQIYVNKKKKKKFEAEIQSKEDAKIAKFQKRKKK